jgi:hypothetical protein
MANEAWSGIDVQLKRNANISKFRTRPIGPRPLSPFSRPLRDDRFLDNVRSLTPAVGEGPSFHCHRPLARWSGLFACGGSYQLIRLRRSSRQGWRADRH